MAIHIHISVVVRILPMGMFSYQYFSVYQMNDHLLVKFKNLEILCINKKLIFTLFIICS